MGERVGPPATSMASPQLSENSATSCDTSLGTGPCAQGNALAELAAPWASSEESVRKFQLAPAQPHLGLQTCHPLAGCAKCPPTLPRLNGL